MHKIRILRLILFLFIFFPSLVYAQDFVVTVKSTDKATSDVFFNLSNIVPGDISENSVEIKNVLDKPLEVYLDKNVKIDDKNLLSKIFLHIYNSSDKIFSRLLSDIDTDLLCYMDASSEENYKFVLEFDRSAGNEYQNAKFAIQLLFIAREYIPKEEETEFLKDTLAYSENISILNRLLHYNSETNNPINSAIDSTIIHNPTTDVLENTDVGNIKEKRCCNMYYNNLFDFSNGCWCCLLKIIMIILLLIIIGLLLYIAKILKRNYVIKKISDIETIEDSNVNIDANDDK